MPTAPGPRANPVCVGGTWAGGVARSATGGGANTRPLVIAKERETLKTLAYDCGNPVLICLRASARSAFLFTGSPRSFHSLAMTRGGNSLSAHHSCHSRARGPRKYECICGVDKAGILYPFSNNSCHSRAGGNRAWIVISYLIWEVYSVLYFHPPAIRGTI